VACGFILFLCAPTGFSLIHSHPLNANTNTKTSTDTATITTMYYRVVVDNLTAAAAVAAEDA
jgi:hypothetical protein